MRGRIGLGMPGLAATAQPEIREQVYHIGHARTILLASDLCRRRGIPLDIRIDASRLALNDGGGAMADLHNLLRFVEVPFRRVYFPAWQFPEEAMVARALGKQTDKFLAGLYRLCAGNVSWATVFCDDIVVNHPSLLIRGQEFGDPLRWMQPKSAAEGMARYVESERELYALAGRRREEVRLPLITVGGVKCSKSAGNAPHWSLLTMTTPAQARAFLRWTARSGQAYEWSWEDWQKKCS
mgnify:FL=1